MLIKEGVIHDPVTKKKYQADILIEDGQIQEVAPTIDRKGHEVVEAKGLWVLPGLIDMHVHLREPGREDEETVLSGMKAAINGGFVSLVCMANTDPPVDDPSVVDYILAEARKVPGFRLYPVGTITKDRKGSQLSEMYLLRERGVVAFSDDGSPIMDALTMRRAMEYCKPLGIPLILHEEDLSLSEGGQMHEGFYSTLLGRHGIPSLSEELVVFRDSALAEAIGVPV
ncbi:amidohydrolase family protein, partial [Candidatus Hakubella thermalkaliphila]